MNHVIFLSTSKTLLEQCLNMDHNHVHVLFKSSFTMILSRKAPSIQPMKVKQRC